MTILLSSQDSERSFWNRCKKHKAMNLTIFKKMDCARPLNANYSVTTARKICKTGKAFIGR
eukprot:7149496-Prymnesium_polylepis.1